jgi:type VI secretion system secreted protein VgrG
MPALHDVHALKVHGVTCRVVEMEGLEEISRLFRFDVTIYTDDDVAIPDVVGKDAALTIQPRDEDEIRYVHGLVSRFELLDRTVRHRVYRVTIVPKAWKLLHRSDARIFQDLTAPEVITKVLEGAGLAAGDDFKVSLQASYRAREYCVQYRESDWDFVSRLMEEEGIAYYFTQTEARHTLVLIDAASAYAAMSGDKTLRYRRDTIVATHEFGTHVGRWSYSEELRSGKVTLRDFNFKNPSLNLESQNQGAANSDLEVYDYPGDYELPADGDGLAKRRLEEIVATRKLAEGDSTCTRMLPGHKFALSEHPVDAQNAEYMLLRVEHRGTEPRPFDPVPEEEVQGTYANRFEAVPATVLFRPPRTTRKPLIHGAQTAIVVGPSGEEIYTDAHGRVKVQFHWDRLGKKNDKSSCWMRVSQPWASAAYGAIFIPRIHDEVVVTFLEGDPDRPLVVGSVYHGTNVPPYALPDQKTRSTIKSNSSKGGDGYNELRFEDKKGAEEVYLHGQKDWTIGIENDKAQKIGRDETLEVGRDRTKEVKHDQKAKVDHDDALEVGNDRKATIGHDEEHHVKNDRKVTVDNDHEETVTGAQTLSVGKAQSLKVGDKQTIEVDADQSLTVKGKVAQSFSKDFGVTVGGDASEKVSGAATSKVDGDSKLTVGGAMTVSVTGALKESTSDKWSMQASSKIEITCGSASVTITPDGKVCIKGGQIELDGSMPVKINGKTVEIAGQGPSKITGATVSLEGQGTTQVKGQMIVLDGQMLSIG